MVWFVSFFLVAQLHQDKSLAKLFADLQTSDYVPSYKQLIQHGYRAEATAILGDRLLSLAGGNDSYDECVRFETIISFHGGKDAIPWICRRMKKGVSQIDDAPIRGLLFLRPEGSLQALQCTLDDIIRDTKHDPGESAGNLLEQLALLGGPPLAGFIAQYRNCPVLTVRMAVKRAEANLKRQSRMTAKH